jgi:3-(3-hydroxy-phenyl)propionate hydroxylase
MMVTPGRYRWEFRLRVGEQPDDLDDAVVQELIRPWLGKVDPGTLTFQRRAWYTFRGAVATHWRDRRVFLLGDAAHLTPPFIGQGLCAGIRDAANLTWKLALVLNGSADDRLLDTYETERLPHARRVIQMAMLVGWLMTGGSSRTSGFRRAALRALTRLPGAEDKVLSVAWPSFAKGALVPRGDRAAGQLCPQPAVRTRDGTMLLDGLLGDGFAIIARDAGDAGVFDPATRAYFEGLKTQFVRLPGTGSLGGSGDTVQDVDGLLTTLFEEKKSEAVLLRPDRVVLASSDRVDLYRWRQIMIAAGIRGKT